MHFKMVFIGWIVQAVLCVIFCASLSNIIKGRLRIKARTQAATQDSCAMNRLQWLLAGGWAKKNFFFLVVLWAFAACALSNWQSCFLNLQAFFSICSAFLYLIVLWAFAARALSNWRSGFLNLQVFFLFAARFFIWLCCEHLQRVRCQIDEVVFLICRCFFYLQKLSPS